MPAPANRLLTVVLVSLLVFVGPEAAVTGGPLDGLASVEPVDAAQPTVRSIFFPVAQPTEFTDTYGACRDGCSRSHKGVDIFAPTLTPLLAAADGVIVSERRNATGKPGNKIVIEDDEGWRYSYFHVNNDSPGTDDDANPQAWIMAGGIRMGDRVNAGQVIGYLGDSGNAEETPPHLHFEIKPPGGAVINPTASVLDAARAGRTIAADDLVAADGDRAAWVDLVDEWYLDLLGREPTDAELAAWTNRLATGLGTEADLVGDLAMAAEFREPEGVALRAYVAAFGTLPTEEAIDALAAEYRAGWDVGAVVDRIVGSTDYAEAGSPLDAGELEALTTALDVKIETWPVLQVVRAYRAVEDRHPTGNELDSWLEHLASGGLMVDVVDGVLDDRLPSATAQAVSYDSDDLGYVDGVNVREGPIDLRPGFDDEEPVEVAIGDGESAEVDIELRVDGDEDGDTANLVVRIPLDELAAAQASGAELSIELNLTRPADPDAEATADADVDLVLVPRDGADRPVVTIPTPTTRPPTTAATRPPAPTTTRPPATTTTASGASGGATTTTTTAPSDPTTTTTTTTGDESTTTTASDDDATTTTTTTDTTGSAAGAEVSESVDGTSTTTQPPATGSTSDDSSPADGDSTPTDPDDGGDTTTTTAQDADSDTSPTDPEATTTTADPDADSDTSPTDQDTDATTTTTAQDADSDTSPTDQDTDATTTAADATTTSEIDDASDGTTTTTNPDDGGDGTTTSTEATAAEDGATTTAADATTTSTDAAADDGDETKTAPAEGDEAGADSPDDSGRTNQPGEALASSTSPTPVDRPRSAPGRRHRGPIIPRR